MNFSEVRVGRRGIIAGGLGATSALALAACSGSPQQVSPLIESSSMSQMDERRLEGVELKQGLNALIGLLGAELREKVFVENIKPIADLPSHVIKDTFQMKTTRRSSGPLIYSPGFPTSSAYTIDAKLRLPKSEVFDTTFPIHLTSRRGAKEEFMEQEVTFVLKKDEKYDLSGLPDYGPLNSTIRTSTQANRLKEFAKELFNAEFPVEWVLENVEGNTRRRNPDSFDFSEYVGVSTTVLDGEILKKYHMYFDGRVKIKATPYK